MLKKTSSLLILSFLLFPVLVGAQLGDRPLTGNLDLKKLTANKENGADLKQAFEVYKGLLLTHPQNYEDRIEAADGVYYLASLTSEKSQKKDYLKQGIEWAKQAIALQPSKPGGHFYYGMLTGMLAEMSGIFTGLSSKDIIKTEMEKVIALDPNYLGGDAYLVLGQWYADVPSAMGGSLEKARQYLEKAAQLSPQKTGAPLALAELYSKSLKYDLAKKQIEQVQNIPLTPTNSFEAKRDKIKAQALLKKIEARLNQPTRGY